jgi:hypothetical protein
VIDFNKLAKDVTLKTTIEDSVEVLLLGVANEIFSHPGDNDKNVELAGGIVEHVKIFSLAVAENIIIP